MNTTNSNDSRRDDTPTAEAGNQTTNEAVVRAEGGTAGWEDAVRLQRWAIPDHTEVYALAGEMVATLDALDDLAAVLGRQVAGYADTQRARGRTLYDDTGQVNPMVRLVGVVEALADTRDALVVVARSVNEFWSAVGHIGTEDGTEDGTADGAADGIELSGGGEASR